MSRAARRAIDALTLSCSSFEIGITCLLGGSEAAGGGGYKPSVLAARAGVVIANVPSPIYPAATLSPRIRHVEGERFIVGRDFCLGAELGGVDINPEAMRKSSD